MKHGLGEFARQIAIFTLISTVGLTVLPWLLRPAAAMLGKDVSQLAAGVADFYPWVAAGEVVRIICMTLVVSAGSGMVCWLPSRGWSRLYRRLALPWAPWLALTWWWIGSALKYPAIYGAILPVVAQGAIFRAAFFLVPSWFYALALLTLMAPAVAWMVVVCTSRCRDSFNKSRHRQGVAVLGLLIVVLAVAGLSRVSRFGIFANSSAAANQAIAVRSAAPNVLLIGIDSLRTDRLDRPEVTPSLRALTADPQTVILRDHWIGVPRTFPSWIEMLQGNYAPKTGVRHMFPGFGVRKLEFSGLVSALRAGGYQTTAISDFAGDIFPRFEAGFATVEAPKLTIKTMIRLAVDQFFWDLMPMMVSGPWRDWFPELKESPVFGDPSHLVEKLQSHIHSDSAGMPWLATVFFSTAHFPYAAPYPYYNMFADTNYGGPFWFEKNPEESIAPASAPVQIAQVRALYDGAVRAIDDQLGLLFASLKQSGLWDSTLIVVTADHGEDLYEEGRLQGHGEHLRGENVLRVPVLLKFPSRQTPRLRAVDFTTRSIDLATTIASAVGRTQAIGSGIDLMPWISGARHDEPALIAYSESEIWFSRGGPGFFQKQRLDYPGISGLLNFDQGYSGEIVLNPIYEPIIVTAKHRMLIEGDWKLIYVPTPEGVKYELYDRRRDPQNLVNLTSTDPVRTEAMRQRLLSFIRNAEGPKARIIDDFVVAQ